MALKMEKELTTGGKAEYWRVSPNMVVNVVDSVVSADVLLYVSEATRRAEKQPLPPHEAHGSEDITPQRVTLTGATALAALQTGDPRPAMYAQLKTLPAFSAAIDA